MSVTVGSRTFAPRIFTTLVTVTLLSFLIVLGRWQLQRAAAKQQLYDAFAQGNQTTRSMDRNTAPLPRYQQVEAAGRYDSSRQVLIDNMFDGARVGYFVITPFALDGGGWVLVNRGWVPLGASRQELPAVPVAGVERRILGRADHLPAAGIRMGDRPALRPPYPVVAAFPSREDIAQLLHETVWTQATDLIDLDAREPAGYARHWSAPGFPPLRHIAYAVQWFGLALALAVIYVITNLKPNAAAAPESLKSTALDD